MRLGGMEITQEQLLKLLRETGHQDNLPLPSPWMTPEETGAYLGIALGTLRNWTSARFIPYSKRGRVVRYHRDKIDQWLSRGSCTGRTTLADV